MSSDNPPDKYYLRRGKQERNLLYYEWQKGKYSFRTYESGGGFLTRITPKGYDPTKPLAGKDLATILFDVYSLDYASIDKVREGFHLPEEVKAGSIFTNMVSPFPNDNSLYVGQIADWQKGVVGFLSHDDICVITYKYAPGGMAGFFYPPPEWMDGGILEKDGAPVKPPALDKK